MPVYAGIPFFGSKGKIGQSSQREARVNEYNDKAMQLFGEGRFKEAQEYWEKAIEIMERPERRGQPSSEFSKIESPADEEILNFEDSDDIVADNVAGVYETAVSLFKEGKYISSKRLFDRVETTIPDYKATRNYLSILGHKIKREQQSLAGGRFKENALSRHEERAEWNRILVESEQELQKKMAEQAAPLYQDAIELYKSRNLKLAKNYFTEVNNILQGYKDTSKYLARIDDDIRVDEQLALNKKRKKEILERKKEQEEWQRILIDSEKALQAKLVEQAEPIYFEAVQHYKRREFDSAKNRFQEVASIIPDYKSTEKYLNRIDGDIKEDILIAQKRRANQLEQRMKEEDLARKSEAEKVRQIQAQKEKERLHQFQKEIAARKKERDEWVKILEQSERERDQNLKEQAENVYREAIQFYKMRQFLQAKESFQEAEKIVPDYKSTKKYLARVDQDIKEEREQIIERKKSALNRKIREKELVQLQMEENDKFLYLQEEEKRLKELQKKALARKTQREEWERVLKETEGEYQQRLAKEAEYVYQEAVRLYNDEQWERAREEFIEAEQIFPDYKGTESYLARIDDSIQESERLRQKKLKDEIEQKKRERSLAEKREKEHQEEMALAQERKRTNQLQGQAEAVYKYALSLYRQKDFAQARQKFLETESLLPEYKSTSQYLKKINKEIAKAKDQRLERQQAEFAQNIKLQRLAKQQEEERIEQLRKAEEKKRSNELQEKTLARQREREEWEKTIKEIERSHQRNLEKQTESIYQEALRYFNAGWFAQAKDAFEEVEGSIPGYKSSVKYIAKTDQKMKEEEQFHRESDLKIRNLQEKGKSLMANAPKEKEGELTTVEDQARNYQRKAAAEKLYTKAYKAYKGRDYVRAKEKFLEVDQVYPHYKKVDKYLKRIDQDIARSQENKQKDQQSKFDRMARRQGSDQRREEQEIEQAKKSEQYQKLKKLNDEALARTRERKELKNSMEVIEREHRDRIMRLAIPVYNAAVKNYNKGDYEQARKGFIEVEQLLPGYKSTDKYLARIYEDIQSNLVLDMENQMPMEKRSKSREFPSMGWDDEDVIDISELPDNTGDVVRQAIDERQKNNSKEAKRIYQEALDLYKANKLTEAKLKFIEVESFFPGYKETADYLGRIDNVIAARLDAAKADNQDRVRTQSIRSPKTKDIDIHQRENVIWQALEDIRLEMPMAGLKNESASLPGPGISNAQDGEWEQRVQKQRTNLKSQRKKLQRKYEREFNGTYDKAVKLYKSCSHQEAYELFKEIDQLRPGYKKASQYLLKISSRIKNEKKKNNNIVVQLEGSKIRQDVIGKALDEIEQRL